MHLQRCEILRIGFVRVLTITRRNSELRIVSTLVSYGSRIGTSRCEVSLSCEVSARSDTEKPPQIWDKTKHRLVATGIQTMMQPSPKTWPNEALYVYLFVEFRLHLWFHVLSRLGYSEVLACNITFVGLSLLCKDLLEGQKNWYEYFRNGSGFYGSHRQKAIFEARKTFIPDGGSHGPRNRYRRSLNCVTFSNASRLCSYAVYVLEYLLIPPKKRSHG